MTGESCSNRAQFAEIDTWGHGLDNDLKHVPIADFATHCVELINQIVQQRHPIVITNSGKPIAKVVPIQDEIADIFGCMAGSVTICGDIINPIDDAGWTGDDENI